MSAASSHTVTEHDLSASAPRRDLRSKNVRKLAAFINGYHSTDTEGAATRVVTSIWIPPALALAVLGGLGLVTGVSDGAAEWMVTIVGATVLLGLFSGAVGLWWLLAVWANARRLGRMPVLRLVDTAIQHGVALAVGMVLLVVARSVPALAAVGIAAVVAGLVFVPRVANRIITELWATSTPVLGDEEPTGLANGWAAAMVVTTAAWAAVEPSVSAGRAPAFVALVAGLGMAAWAVVTITIVGAVTRRQDERLHAIVEGVRTAEAAPRPGRPSSAEVADAWRSSEGMIGVAGA